MESFLKFSEESKNKIVDTLSSEAVKLFIDNTKGVNDSGTFEMVITTDDVDRMGETVKIDGWDLSYYMKSPVVLWGHNYGLMPVGITDSIHREGNGLVAKGRFAPTEMGQTLRKLYDAGMLKASSVGFMVLEQEGNSITKSQLLEWSFVSVPANPYALSLRELNDIKSPYLADLVIKSIEEKIKISEPTKQKEGGVGDGDQDEDDQPTQAEGNPCIGVDGKPGKWTKVGNALVCVISEASIEPQKEKGAVADELSAEEKMEQKYKNLNTLFDVVYALCNVYMDDKVAVTDFSKLLTETISILGKVADGTYTAVDDSEKGLVYTSIKSITSEIRKERIIVLQNIFTAKSEDGSKDNEEEANKEDEAEGGDTEEAKAILASKKIIQFVATAMADGLRDLRKTSKKTLY